MGGGEWEEGREECPQGQPASALPTHLVRAQAPGEEARAVGGEDVDAEGKVLEGGCVHDEGGPVPEVLVGRRVALEVVQVDALELEEGLGVSAMPRPHRLAQHDRRMALVGEGGRQLDERVSRPGQLRF